MAEAAVEGDSAPGRWTVFRSGRAGTGAFSIAARAIDTSGATQPECVTWNPGGYHHAAWHKLAIAVKR